MAEVFYNILTEFWVPMELVNPIKKFLNERYSEVRIGKICLMHFYSERLEKGAA
jgi:hypothetical protein